MLDLSIVVGTLERPDAIRRLIDSIVANTKVSYELLIGDASKVPLAQSSVPAAVRVLLEQPRLGFVKGYNRCFRECKGPWVVWLNDDAVVTPSWDTEAIGVMEANPHVGLGCLAYSECGGPFYVRSYADMVYANFGIMPRSFGDEIGWFNEKLVMYGVDNAITFDVLLHNRFVVPINTSCILHMRADDELRKVNAAGAALASAKLTELYGAKMSTIRATYECLRKVPLAQPKKPSATPSA